MGGLLLNKWVHTTVLLFILVIICSYGHKGGEWYLRLQNYVFDQLNKNFPRERSDQVIIVSIDDKDLEEIGQWPWPRNILANIVNVLSESEAQSIAFDGAFPESDRLSPIRLKDYAQKGIDLNKLPDNDKIFAKAIKDSGRYVSAFTYAHEDSNAGKPKLKTNILFKVDTEIEKDIQSDLIKNANSFPKATKDISILEEASKGHGAFLAHYDFDGVIRKYGVLVTDHSKLYPALAVESVRVAVAKGAPLIIKAKMIKSEGNITMGVERNLAIRKNIVPMDDKGRLIVYYRQFSEDDHKDFLPARFVLNPEKKEYVKALVKNKIVIIGPVAAGLKDFRNTSIETFQPGVEVHANVVEQILQGKFLSRPDYIKNGEILSVILIGMLFISVVPFISLPISFSICVTVIIGAFYASIVGYTEHKLLIDPIYPSLSIFTIFLTASMLKYIRTEAERKQVKDAFGLYISPEYMNELTSDSSKLKLGGESRELTTMFSDIRSFTTISESLTSEELIQLMNDFLTPMSDLVMEHRGTIDKYMGDAMMAFWNAPLDDEYHAYNACITALGMQKALEPINEQVKAKALAENRTPTLLNAGIGINTGPCSVGNMGSKQRFAYSALGDAVNLASRLEGQTKQYGLNILVGEETVNQAEGLAFLEIDLIQVKGKTKPVRIFTLIGDENVANSNVFNKWKRHHDQMLSSYRNQQWSHAQDLIAVCKSDDVFDNHMHIDDYYDIMNKRIDDLRNETLPEDWDGVFIATTK